MNKYAYPWEDEIMEECRQRKAELLEKYGGWEGYSKHLDGMRPYFEAQGWHYETPEERTARMARAVEVDPAAIVLR
jgi:hypothetical protein